jgi:hypothetical protein
LERLLPLDLENLLKMTLSVHFLSDGWMDSKDVWYTDVSWRDAGQVEYVYDPITIEGVIALGLRKLENDSFCSFSQWWFDGFKLYLVYRYIMKGCRFFIFIFFFFERGGRGELHFHTSSTSSDCWNNFSESWYEWSTNDPLQVLLYFKITFVKSLWQAYCVLFVVLLLQYICCFENCLHDYVWVVQKKTHTNFQLNLIKLFSSFNMK